MPKPAHTRQLFREGAHSAWDLRLSHTCRRLRCASAGVFPLLHLRRALSTARGVPRDRPSIAMRAMLLRVTFARQGQGIRSGA